MTDYPRSLALWAGTTDDARLADDDATRAAYWDSCRKAIRQAEPQQQEQLVAEVAANAQAASSLSEVNVDVVPAGGDANIMAARPLHECRWQARYGSGPNTVRMEREYTATELMNVVPEVFGGVAALGG